MVVAFVAVAEAVEGAGLHVASDFVRVHSEFTFPTPTVYICIEKIKKGFLYILLIRTF